MADDPSIQPPTPGVQTAIAKLQGVHPRLVAAIVRVRYAMSELGLTMIVTDGVRTQQEQQFLYAQGRTAPGKVVTEDDGVNHRSRHQVKADGFGHACDCVFLVDGQPSWDEKLPWRLYGEMLKSQNLVWGGDWASFRDLPHAELPAGV